MGDATSPPTGDEVFEVVLSRHLMWTLPDPEAALREWVQRLRPGGRVVLVEGRWRESGHREALRERGGTPAVARRSRRP
ncbi:class I SAM-dependent methyltransferase [Actinoallomurus spadix]|uniref:Methyltransferase type 11 domain-containing protein n=1 Tax=Actinoallomurus spadix TaxID=79912 RepID=A0ABP3G0B3_9ACTN